MEHLIYVDLSCTTLEDLEQPQDQLICVKPGDEDDDFFEYVFNKS